MGRQSCSNVCVFSCKIILNWLTDHVGSCWFLLKSIIVILQQSRLVYVKIDGFDARVFMFITLTSYRVFLN